MIRKTTSRKNTGASAGNIFRRILAMTLTLVLLTCFAGCGGNGDVKDTDAATDAVTVSDTDTGSASSDTQQSVTDKAEDAQFTVIPDKASTLKLVDKDTEAFTMQIPEGWEMRYGWDGEKMLLIHVYDPETPVNQIFYATDMVPFMKSEESVGAYAASNTLLFSEAPILDPPTNETLFKQIPKLRSYYIDTLKSEKTAEMIPEIYDFELLETLTANSAFGDSSLDDSIIYGTFKTADGSAEGEGIGFASIVDLFGVLESPLYGVDMAYYNVYNFTAITGLRDEFVNYEDLLCRSFASLQLKQEFVAKMISNNEESLSSLQQVNNEITQSYYAYNDAWSARSQSADISRQKWSDATLGYERVYNEDTGEIYKAYNGFSEDFPDSVYQPITEDMYSMGWSGYIEK
ncbi:MAG: hypothetical protein IJT70_05520 [Clostridia bacterium]|nr:hypothetical protein [Clostridia bacterium]